MRTITCFGDRTSGTFLIIALVSRTDNFVNGNVLSSVNKCYHQNHFCVPLNIISLSDALPLLHIA